MTLLHNIFTRLLAPFSAEYKDIVNGVWAGMFSVAWFLLIGTVIERIQTYDVMTVIKILSLSGITIGVYVAIWKISHDQAWRRSETYLEQAASLIERSFNKLEIDDDTKYPKNDRYLWLSSARLLLASLALAEKITDESHKTTWGEITDYWRTEFNALLIPDGQNPMDKYYYYEEGALRGWSSSVRSPISDKSITVIYRFMAWPQGQDDRLYSKSYLTNDFTDDELILVAFNNEGLCEYLQELKKNE